MAAACVPTDKLGKAKTEIDATRYSSDVSISQGEIRNRLPRQMARQLLKGCGSSCAVLNDACAKRSELSSGGKIEWAKQWADAGGITASSASWAWFSLELVNRPA